MSKEISNEFFVIDKRIQELTNKLIEQKISFLGITEEKSIDQLVDFIMSNNFAWHNFKSYIENQDNKGKELKKKIDEYKNHYKTIYNLISERIIAKLMDKEKENELGKIKLRKTKKVVEIEDEFLIPIEFKTSPIKDYILNALDYIEHIPLNIIDKKIADRYTSVVTDLYKALHRSLVPDKNKIYKELSEGKPVKGATLKDNYTITEI